MDSLPEVLPVEKPEAEKEEVDKRDWSELIPVCLMNIFSRLSIEDRWKGSMFVCKSWFEASIDPSLFNSFDIERRFESNRDTPVWWTPVFERKIDAMVRSVAIWSNGNLREIRVRHCSDLSLGFLAERCPQLQILSIKNCQNVTDVSIAKIATRCTFLRELDISYCYEISYEAIELVGRQCPNLTILKRNFMNYLDPSQHNGVPTEYLNSCPQDGDREVSSIARFMHNLNHLELRFSRVSAEGLTMIAKNCQCLEYLDIFGCANLTSRAIENASANLKNLKTLIKPNLYIPRSIFHVEKYDHWNLYDDRFQTNFFQI